MEIATIYESRKFDQDEPILPFSELYPKIREEFAAFCKKNEKDGVQFNEAEETIVYKSTHITFYLTYSGRVRRFFLCVIPKNIWKYSSKSVLISAASGLIEFFNKLPGNFEIFDLKFTKSSNIKEINASDWSFSTNPDSGINKFELLRDFGGVKKVCTNVLNPQNNKLHKKLLLIDASEIFQQGKVNQLVQKVTPFFPEKIEQIKNSENTLEIIDQRIDKLNLAVIFIGPKEVIDKIYGKYKTHFIINNIPSQFVELKKIDQILSWGYENFLLELFKKINNEELVKVDPPLETNVDAYLCLSEIGEVENNKFFGISIAFSGDGNAVEWIEVYNDIDYETKRNTINFKEGELTKLSEKIKVLSNLQGKKIDVIVSRNWSASNASFLCKLLENNQVTVRKFFYVSPKTSKFIFSSITEEKELFKHQYIIWDERVASIQTNTKVQLYGTLFPLHIELINPWADEKLNVDDLKTILWLVKKRMYRIDNFHSLKLPEILRSFDRARKLKLSEIPGRFRISIHMIV